MPPVGQIGVQKIRGQLKRKRKRKRTTTWATFVRTHVALLAGTDFFTAEVLTLRGFVTYYVLFFIHLDSREWTSPGSPFIRVRRG